jgi:outer membrane protein assembly factor BamD
MLKNINRSILFLLIISAFVGCSSYNKLVRSTDMEKKYYMAKQYYEKGDCVKALQLLEELVTVYKSTAKAESIYYYYAYANYCTEDYIVAAYHFKNFSRLYPNSGHAEECLFMGAYCFSQESPRYSLDQADTKSAIKEMQVFINRYPNSKLIDSCNHIIDRLRGKLEKKSFEIAKQYYDIEDYKGAMIAFQNLIKDYPDTKYREEALFYHLKASYKYAYHSIETKKLSRLDNTIEFYNKFITLFPQSRFLKEAEDIYKDTQKLKSRQKVSPTASNN